MGDIFTLSFPVWLLALILPAVFGSGVWVWRYSRRATPSQMNHDRILLETLAAQETRVNQLKNEVDGLERQVRRLREDLHYEREENRRLRREIGMTKTFNPHEELVMGPPSE